MRKDYPRYFASMDGLLGLNALSILGAFYGLFLIYRSNKKSVYSFLVL
jgi:hypothetical protein